MACAGHRLQYKPVYFTSHYFPPREHNVRTEVKLNVQCVLHTPYSLVLEWPHFVGTAVL